MRGVRVHVRAEGASRARHAGSTAVYGLRAVIEVRPADVEAFREGTFHTQGRRIVAALRRVRQLYDVVEVRIFLRVREAAIRQRTGRNVVEVLVEDVLDVLGPDEFNAS